MHVVHVQARYTAPNSVKFLLNLVGVGCFTDDRHWIRLTAASCMSKSMPG